MDNSMDRSRHPGVQTNIPRIDTTAANAPHAGNIAASPMALDSPITQGFKRTADGAVKGIESVDFRAIAPMAAHKRNKSMDVHSSSRIGEVRTVLLSCHG